MRKGNMSKFKGFGKEPVKKVKLSPKEALIRGIEAYLEKGVKDPETGLVYVTLPTGKQLVAFQDDGKWWITEESVEKSIDVPRGSFAYWVEHVHEPKHGSVESRTVYLSE